MIVNPLARGRARVRSTMHPDGYHGDDAKAPYFEGWYVKLVSADRAARLAVIPGVFLGQGGGTDEAFVQVLDGASGRSWYHRFDRADFHAASDRFDVTVGGCHFDASGFTLDLPGLSGRVEVVGSLDPWPVTVRSPGVMGWYAWMPYMECYHGVCSFGHDLAGSLTLDDAVLNFDAGRGYIEKDWGKGFPSGYVWAHSNHFSSPGTSLMASIALIPWLRSEFRGFLVGLQHAGRLHTFATYNGAKTTRLEIDDDEVRWTVRGRDGSILDLVAQRVGGTLLHAPIRTEMHQRVEETLDATIAVRLVDPAGRVLVDDVGSVGGLEVHGELERLLSTEGK